jgi:predicted SAM-dependent methyltransferase
MRTNRLKLLNVGCGQQFHRDWENIDLEPRSIHVRSHDVTSGLPYSSNSFDGVYHSHVLEHLKTEQGRALLAECYRVLKPGGVLRVVVPDLERIAALYLQMHRAAWDGDETAKENYHWMKLELLDQLVRESSGGKMGQYIARHDRPNDEFVFSRLGDEVRRGRSAIPPIETTRHANFRQRLGRSIGQLRERLAKRAVRLLLGKHARTVFETGLFRSRGEIHQWMYDRFSLRGLCEELGFENFAICEADESRIENFSAFELDSVSGQTRKPDSLFVESQKPRPAIGRIAA